MTNWNEIRKAAEAAGFYNGWMMAADNARDATGTDSGAEFEEIALYSLKDALANGSLCDAERDFFIALGVEF